MDILEKQILEFRHSIDWLESKEVKELEEMNPEEFEPCYEKETFLNGDHTIAITKHDLYKENNMLNDGKEIKAGIYGLSRLMPILKNFYNQGIEFIQVRSHKLQPLELIPLNDKFNSLTDQNFYIAPVDPEEIHCEHCSHFDGDLRQCDLNELRDIPTPDCKDYKGVEEG